MALVLGCEPMDWASPEDPSSSSSSDTSASAEAPADAPRAPSEQLSPDKALVLSDEEQAALDPRPSRLHPRALSLLMTEMQGLQSLMRASPRSAPDLPNLLRRLAEDYVEVAASADHDAISPPQRAMAPPLRSSAETAREAAIAVYTMLLDTPFSRPYAGLDEVRWYRALEYARAGKVERAKSAAADVLALSPDSPWASRAHFLLGVELALDPSKKALAVHELETAARSSQAGVARVAMQRLGGDRSEETTPRPAAPPVLAHAPTPVALPTPVRAAPTPVATATAAVAERSCTLDMDCDGMNVCRQGVCVPPK